MKPVYRITSKKIRDVLLGLGHKIDYEYPNEYYFICTPQFLEHITEIKREQLEK